MQWQRDLIVSHVKLAELAEARRRHRDAVDHYIEALGIARELASTDRLAPADAERLPELDRRLATAQAKAGRGGEGE